MVIWYELSLHVRSPPPLFFPLALVRDRPHAAISNGYGYGLIRLSYYSPSFNKDKCMFVHSNLRSILFFMKRLMIDVWQYVDCPRTEENIVIVFYTVSLNKYSHFFPISYYHLSETECKHTKFSYLSCINLEFNCRSPALM